MSDYVRPAAGSLRSERSEHPTLLERLPRERVISWVMMTVAEWVAKAAVVVGLLGITKAIFESWK